MCWLCNFRSLQFAEEQAGDAISPPAVDTDAELATSDAEPPPPEARDVRITSE